MCKKYFLLALGGLLSFALSAMQQQSALQDFPEVKTKKAVEAAQAETLPASKFTYSPAEVAKLVKKLLPELQNNIWLQTQADVLDAKSYQLLGRWQLFQDQTVLAQALSGNGKIAAFLFLVADDRVRLEWQTLYSRDNCIQKSVILQGYTATDIKIYFSKDAKFLVIHSPDSGLLQVIDVATGALVHQYTGAWQPLCCIDSTFIAACERDGAIYLVDALKKKPLFGLAENEEQDWSDVVVAMSSDGHYFLWAYGGMLHVVEASSVEVKASFNIKALVSGVVQVEKVYMRRRYSDEGLAGYYLVVVVKAELPAAQDGGQPLRWNHVIYIDGASRECMEVGTIKEAPHDEILFSRDNKKMLFATASNKIIFCSLKKGLSVHRYPYEGELVGLSLAPDASYYVMARASEDSGRVDKYALTAAGDGLGKLTFDVPVRTFAISNAGDNVLVLTSQGASVCMFEDQTKKLVQKLHLDDQKFLYKLLAQHHKDSDKDGRKAQVVKAADIENLPAQILRALDAHKVAEL